MRRRCGTGGRCWHNSAGVVLRREITCHGSEELAVEVEREQTGACIKDHCTMNPCSHRASVWSTARFERLISSTSYSGCHTTEHG